MADNRQFTDHNTVGGVNVYLEDKKLGELKDATAVSTMSSTQFIPIQDSTDGSLSKISASNLASVLGVFKKSKIGDITESNVDNAKDSGIYQMVWIARNRYGVLVVFNCTAFVIQLFGYAEGIMYRRFIKDDNYWGTWYELANT